MQRGYIQLKKIGKSGSYSPSLQNVRNVLLGGLSSVPFQFQARTSSEEAFLINPFGLLYSEITASSLVKCDKDGNILDEGRTSLGINAAGFALHSVLHEARKDIKCIIHVHTPAGAAVSKLEFTQYILKISSTMPLRFHWGKPAKAAIESF